MMIIDLRDVFSHKAKNIKIQHTMDFSDYQSSGVNPIKNVKFSGEIINTADIITLNGTAEFDYTAPCDRCTVEVTKPMSIDISHVIVDSLSNEDEDEFIVAENMQIHLDEILKTDIILSLPYIFLCKEDCKGICSGCGKNLNEEECVCKKEIDPRLEKLNEFFE